ncbi:MAG: hypothetical protein ABW215_00425 [Kibdelosporangium sp.]
MNRRPASARSAMRGWTLASSSAALAIAAHGLAGGGAPDTTLAVLLTMLVAWAGTSVADRFHGLTRMLTALGSSQLGMHLILNYVVPAHIGHQAAPVGQSGMLLTHVTATVITAVLLTKADAAIGLVTSAMRLLLDLLEPPRFPVVPAAVHPVPVRPELGDHLRSVVLRRVNQRRGPPACS